MKYEITPTREREEIWVKERTYADNVKMSGWRVKLHQIPQRRSRETQTIHISNNLILSEVPLDLTLDCILTHTRNSTISRPRPSTMSQHPSRPSPASAINVYPLDHIEIPPSDVGQTLQGFLNYGSERASGVTPDDITVKVSWIPATSRPGLRVLLRCGMKFFDAVYWLAAGQVAGNRRLVVDRAFTADKIPSLHTVSQAVFDVYAFLLKEGKYPSPQVNTPQLKFL